MTSIQDTAYPRLKHQLTAKALTTVYTPSEEEVVLAEGITRSRVTKVAFLLLLKTFQRLGYPVLMKDIPASIIQHISTTAAVSVSATALAHYDRSGSRRRHLKVMRDYLGVTPYGEAAQTVMVEAMTAAAQTKHDLADLINVAIEELVKTKFELPAFSTLQRAAFQVRTAVTQGFYQQVDAALDTDDYLKLNRLFIQEETATTLWNRLKQEPGKPMLSHLNALVDRLHWLQDWQIATGALKALPWVKLKQFAAEAQTLSANQMREMAPHKRYTLAAALLSVQHARTLDDLAEMLIKRLRKMHHNAREALVQYRQETQKRTDTLVTTLREVIVAYQQEGSVAERLAGIETVLGPQAETLLEHCDAHMAYADNNYLPFLQRFYKSHRATLFRFLDVVPLHSSTQDQQLEAAIHFIRQHRTTRSTWLTVPMPQPDDSGTASSTTALECSWIPSKWWKLVTGQAPSQRSEPPTQLHRQQFEICVFSQILLELQSGDLYITGSAEYGDYYSQLVTWEDYDAQIEAYGQQVNLPVEPTAFVRHVQQWLAKAATATDEAFPTNTQVVWKDERLTIRRPPRQRPAGLTQLEALVAERLTPVHLLDVLTDTEAWLNWTHHFGPISGHEAKLEHPVERYLATTFCYGCNIGPSQTARALRTVDRKQLAWVNQRHITEATLQTAIGDLINAYNRFALPKFWGTGERASVDGTKWDIYENNLLAEYHIRYGGYGGIGYYHVSDTYIALFSHFIPCGVWEAVFILDGLLKNESDIQPDTLHGDTQAQSATVFALAYLLGITLMPRIRNWKALTFYRPARAVRYQHIDGLFSDTINWGLIETHLPDMLRVAISIKCGRINASTILRKLGTNSRKNKLYQAFYELGCAVRTGFLLQYINDADLRSTIQAATNKSEAFNAFVQWLAFGGDGTLSTNSRDEQRKRIKYNHLVANTLIFYNVFELTRILHELNQQGYELEAEALAELSPYLTQHVNRFGLYHLDLERQPQAINYDVPIATKSSP
jgi:TnpA family transposase